MDKDIFLQAKELFKTGKLDAAEVIFLKLLNNKLYKNQVLFELSILYQKKNMYDEACYCLFENLKTGVDSKNILELAKIAIIVGDLKIALEILNSKYVDSNDSRVSYLKGLIEYKKENYIKARQYLKGINYSAKQYDVIKKTGLTYRLAGNSNQAKKYFNKFLNTPYQKQILLELINIAFEQEENDIERLINIFSHTNCCIDALNLDFNRSKIYFKYINNQLREENLDSYFAKQLYDYSKDRSLEKIKKHKLLMHKASFRLISNLDLGKLYDDCLKVITSDNLVTRDKIDKYKIHLPYDVGYLNENITDSLEVITIPFTDKILTVYPVCDYTQDNVDYKVLKKIKEIDL